MVIPTIIFSWWNKTLYDTWHDKSWTPTPPTFVSPHIDLNKMHSHAANVCCELCRLMRNVFPTIIFSWWNKTLYDTWHDKSWTPTPPTFVSPHSDLNKMHSHAANVCCELCRLMRNLSANLLDLYVFYVIKHLWPSDVNIVSFLRNQPSMTYWCKWPGVRIIRLQCIDMTSS
jgi:hypothetical protein